MDRNDMSVISYVVIFRSSISSVSFYSRLMTVENRIVLTVYVICNFNFF